MPPNRPVGANRRFARADRGAGLYRDRYAPRYGRPSVFSRLSGAKSAYVAPFLSLSPQTDPMPDGPNESNLPNRLPTLIGTTGVVLPPGETDETKRFVASTWARTQNLRSLALAASALATVLSAMILAGC